MESANGLIALNQQVVTQASWISYLNAFHLMMILTLATIPLILLARWRRSRAPGARSRCIWLNEYAQHKLAQRRRCGRRLGAAHGLRRRPELRDAEVADRRIATPPKRCRTSRCRRTAASAAVPELWWTLFQSPKLNDTVQTRRSTGNRNLQAAQATLKQAQELLGVAEGEPNAGGDRPKRPTAGRSSAPRFSVASTCRRSRTTRWAPVSATCSGLRVA